jgi:hypothetical protein
MTWIVGTVPPFGYSILVSDIRVSWADGTERDCLQKIHKVGHDLLCGFAGSVRIGFGLLNALSIQLPRKQRRTPSVLVHDWIPSLARRVFRAAPESELKLGCQFIIAAAHPTENLGAAPWPRTYIWTFSYPDFSPQKCGPDAAVGIGSGSVVSAYAAALREARSNVSFLKLITHGEDAQVQYLARTMRESVLKNPKAGVSPFFQMGIVTRGRTLLGDYGHTRFERDGTTNRVRAPPTAQTYKAFQDFCRTERLNATCAVCSLHAQ